METTARGCRPHVVSIRWGRELAEAYDRVAADDFAPAVLDPMVDLLAELADGGPVVEFGVGTGRVALPLAARGLACRGSSCRRRWPNSCATGLRIRERWGGWRREPFTADSTSQVAVFERTPLT